MFLDKEPAVILGVLQAALALAIGFGLKISPEQMGLIMAFAAAVVALVVRQNVFSQQSVEKIVAAATVAGAEGAMAAPDEVNPDTE